MATLRTTAAALLVALVLPASAAAVSDYAKVLRSYERNGAIPACGFSSAQLSSALKGVDTYGAQYFADFTDAINSALAARAGGQCIGQSSRPQATPADISGRLANQPLSIGSVTAATSGVLPVPILLMALIAGSIAIALVFGGFARMRGWDPSWLAGWRHSFGEAGYRAGGAWAGFVDWLRSA